jgi:hypothetical protein
VTEKYKWFVKTSSLYYLSPKRDFTPLGTLAVVWFSNEQKWSIACLTDQNVWDIVNNKTYKTAHRAMNAVEEVLDIDLPAPLA